MTDVADWSVRELKKYLASNGINPNVFKQKSELIHRVSSIISQNKQADFNKNLTACLIIIATFLLLNVFFRQKMRQIYWLNPKYVGSYCLLSLIWIYEKLLAINMVCSWVLPPTAKKWNFIDTYFVKSIQPFPLAVPVNWDNDAQDATMWIDVFPMLLLYFLRTCKQYIQFNYHYLYYGRFRDGYYNTLSTEDRHAERYHNAQMAIGDYVQRAEIRIAKEDGEFEVLDGDEAEETSQAIQQALIASLANQTENESLNRFVIQQRFGGARKSPSILSEMNALSEINSDDESSHNDVDNVDLSNNNSDADSVNFDEVD